jgi:hypothetical protein
VVSDPSGYTVGLALRTTLANGFVQVGEALNQVGGGASLRDLGVRPGRKYTYRIYSVDIFGNKSERPREVSLFVPDRSVRLTDLRKPNMLVEVDARTGKTKVTFSCDDPRIVMLFLSRRDFTIGQHAFAPPGQVSDQSLGLVLPGRNRTQFEGEVYRGDGAWDGSFFNTRVEETFIDQTVQLDHSYQYQLYGVDVFGNRTPYEISERVLVVRRPLVEEPVGLRASVEGSTSGRIAGVRLSWRNGNLDIGAEDLLGSVEDREDSSVRTLYQVERRAIDEDSWERFPMVSDESIFDPVAGSVPAPPYRPAFLDLERTYVYRVQAFQTGGFVSNFCHPVEVFVGLPVIPPVNFRALPSDPKSRPFHVMLNWDTDRRSGTVDRWEIERVAVNNEAAARIDSRDVRSLIGLPFRPFRTVYRESSRFRSRTLDDKIPLTAGKTITGMHHFLDSDVKFGNTYYYRIRSVSPRGEVSSWVARAARVVDKSFERKKSSLLSNVEKESLIRTIAPVTVKDSVLASPIEKLESSLSLISNFAKPEVSSTSPVVPIVELAPALSDVTAPFVAPSPTIEVALPPGVGEGEATTSLQDLDFTAISQSEPEPIASAVLTPTQLTSIQLTAISPSLSTLEGATVATKPPTLSTAVLDSGGLVIGSTIPVTSLQVAKTSTPTLSLTSLMTSYLK